jgi:hypothetical protein
VSALVEWATSYTVDDADAFQALAEEKRWGDGLPLVPATVEKVQAMLGPLAADSGRVLGLFPPRFGEATIESLAINAVMAGCRPGVLPIIVAAVEAMLEPQFNLFSIQATTHPGAVMLLVSGPIARQVGIHGGSGLFGPGFQANATIGRAIRLIQTNVGGAYPGETDLATQGTPAKFTFCFTENEDDSPYEPHRVTMGYDLAETTVTVAQAEAPHNLNDHVSEDPKGLLVTFAQTIATMGKNNAYLFDSDYFLVLGLEHANILHRYGWSKKDVQKHLFERARIPYRLWRLGGMAGMTPKPRYIDADDEDLLIPMCAQAEDVRILVGGGNGRHSCWIPTFGIGRSVTRRIGLV